MVHVLDTHQLGTSGIIAATAVEVREGLVLFDTGPESTFDTIAKQLHGIGFDARDVGAVFLSHIHFDHAGAAWRFAELGAKVYVHAQGAPHLVDPSRLVASATRIFGENMGKLWGNIRPIPAENVFTLADGDVVGVAPFEIRAIETPGHASHHHVYVWEDNLFGGDVAGVRLGAGPPIPPFVPPELNVESWIESLEKIRRANPAKLYLPHFGLVRDSVPAHLSAVEERVKRWSEWFLRQLRAKVSEEQLIAAFAGYEKNELLGKGANENLAADYEIADPSYMAIPAMLRYWRKYHPEQVSG